MLESKISPYLTTKLGKKQCSACGLEFSRNSKASLSKAFAEHVREVHKEKEPDEGPRMRRDASL